MSCLNPVRVSCCSLFPSDEEAATSLNVKTFSIALASFLAMMESISCMEVVPSIGPAPFPDPAPPGFERIEYPTLYPVKIPFQDSFGGDFHLMIRIVDPLLSTEISVGLIDGGSSWVVNLTMEEGAPRPFELLPYMRKQYLVPGDSLSLIT